MTSGSRVSLLALLLLTSGCGLVAGIDDVHLVSDAATDTTVDEDTRFPDSFISLDGDFEVSRDDGLPDSGADTPFVIGDATDADADVSTGPSCAAPLHGMSMTLITAPGAVYFCIDKHEVTNEEFNEYLADLSLPYDSHPACGGFKTSSRPSPKTTPAVAKRPVSGVNYCYAWAYCKWAGKRLCGKIGGGHAAPDGAEITNEWYYACANGLKETQFPYGNTYDGTKCNTNQPAPFTTSMLVDVGSMASCHGNDPGHDQLFDMSGNVWEFDDWATNYGTTASGITVHSHGGAATDGALDGKCGTNNSFGIGTPFGDVGFRCCADAVP